MWMQNLKADFLIKNTLGLSKFHRMERKVTFMPLFS